MSEMAEAQKPMKADRSSFFGSSSYCEATRNPPAGTRFAEAHQVPLQLPGAVTLGAQAVIAAHQGCCTAGLWSFEQ